MHTLFKTYGI